MKQSNFVKAIALISAVIIVAGFIIQDTNYMLQKSLDENSALTKTNKHYADIIDKQDHEIKNLKGQLNNQK